MRGKKLILEATETGCIIPTSHKLNQDGYFRKRTNGVLEMYIELYGLQLMVQYLKVSK